MRSTCRWGDGVTVRPSGTARSAVQCSAVQCSAVQYSAVQRCDRASRQRRNMKRFGDSFTHLVDDKRAVHRWVDAAHRTDDLAAQVHAVAMQQPAIHNRLDPNSFGTPIVAQLGRQPRHVLIKWKCGHANGALMLKQQLSKRIHCLLVLEQLADHLCPPIRCVQRGTQARLRERGHCHAGREAVHRPDQERRNSKRWRR